MNRYEINKAILHSLLIANEANKSQRFGQLLSNELGVHFLGSANDSSGNGFRDFFHLESSIFLASMNKDVENESR